MIYWLVLIQHHSDLGLSVKKEGMKKLFLVAIIAVIVSTASAQCTTTTMMSEDFDGPTPIQGAILSNIYGIGAYNNASYILSGTYHGWFNVITGIGDVDVYDRYVTGFCVGQPVDVSLWMRESYGGTSVTVSVEDDLGTALASQTLTLNGTFQQIIFNFPAATTGLHLIIHCNSTGGSGIDIVVEDILITSCLGASEDINYTDCTSQNAIDLFSFFSSAIAATGTWAGPSALSNGNLGTFDPSINTSGLYTYDDPINCSFSSVNVNIPPALDLGPDTTICSGTSIPLNAGSGFDTYSWNGGSQNSSINVSQPGIYTVEVGTMMDNLVVGGDFEDGTTSSSNNFTTSYIPGTGGSWGLLSSGGQYAITTSPNLVHTNFVSCGDISSGSSNMLVANGSWTPNTIVWSQTVPVNPNTDYLFSFWATNVVNNPNTSDLQLYVNGFPIGPVNSTTTACNWNQISDVWNSAGATSATLSIVNQSTTASGNDFAIDEITFAPLCIQTDTVVVSVESITQSLTTMDPSCAGSSNGEIYISSALGVEFSNDNGSTWQTDTFFVNLPASNYTICSKSALGCTVCNNVSLIDPSGITISVSQDTTVCENGAATLSASATGGTSFDFHWDFTSDLSASQIVTPSALSSYSVYAENEFGCISSSETISVDLYPPLDATISLATTICPGDNTQVEANVSGGIGSPYTFIWSSGDTITTNGMSIVTVQPSDTTEYTVVITDGCETSPFMISSFVNVAPLPVPELMVMNPNQCEPAVFEVTYTGDPSLAQSVTWIVNNDDVFIDQNSIYTGPWMAGNYPIQLIVTSPEGCVDSANFVNALHVDPIPTASFTFSPSPPQMFHTEVVFNNNSFGATNYEWYFEEGNPETSSIEDPTVIFPDGETGTYEVMLIAISEYGCSDTTIIDVQVLPEILLYAPNTFTPDGDEHNQAWGIHIEGIDIYNFELAVYNRWGETVWETLDPLEQWDATYNGLPVQDGTYIWEIKTKNLLNDEMLQFRGHVNILR